MVSVTAGQRYTSSFWLTSPSAFVTGTTGSGGIEVAGYFGSCGSGGGCTTNLGNGFSVQVPTSTGPGTSVIDTTHGDIAANTFSLGSPAAQAGAVAFDGGVLRMTGGALQETSSLRR